MSSKANPAAANVRSPASVLSNTVTTANPYQEKTHRNPNQPLFICLYLWFSSGCHRKGSGRFPPAHAEFAILLSLLCDGVGFAGGGMEEPTAVPAALCASCRGAGCRASSASAACTKHHGIPTDLSSKTPYSSSNADFTVMEIICIPISLGEQFTFAV